MSPVSLGARQPKRRRALCCLHPIDYTYSSSALARLATGVGHGVCSGSLLEACFADMGRVARPYVMQVLDVSGLAASQQSNRSLKVCPQALCDAMRRARQIFVFTHLCSDIVFCSYSLVLFLPGYARACSQSCAVTKFRHPAKLTLAADRHQPT